LAALTPETEVPDAILPDTETIPDAAEELLSLTANLHRFDSAD
jgi:hypothetical protein